MTVLYKRAQKREADTLKFHAVLHGAKFDDDPVIYESEQSVRKSYNENKESSFVFKDPKYYKKLSPEEREELTKKMMASHKNWVESKKPLELKAPRRVKHG